MAEPEPVKIIDPATAPYKGYLTLVINRVRLYMPTDLKNSAAGLSGLDAGYGLYLPEISFPDRQLVQHRKFQDE
jgi:hypothetical protein